MLDVGLYVHVPFCVRKCGYCDFYSTPADDQAFAPLVDAIICELSAARAARPMRIDTLFVGGGTPTVLPENALHRLMTALNEAIGGHDEIEFSVEANPVSLTAEKAAILHGSGVNRISMGAQSFHRSELAVLDRLHDPDDIVASAGRVRDAGFDRLNLDLIFGIPGQTPASWAESLRRAMDLGPDHLACYGLTYEPGTPLYDARAAGRVQPMDEEREVDLYLAAVDGLTSAGWRQYEISNFARAGGQCLHNLRYWRNRSTLGIGPAAASYLDGRRWRNVPDGVDYVERMRSGRDVRTDVETLPPTERAGETAMLGLRLIEGIEPAAFAEETGFDPHRLFAGVIGPHVRAGRLRVAGGRIALTRSGLLLADAVIGDFLAAARSAGCRRRSDPNRTAGLDTGA